MKRAILTATFLAVLAPASPARADFHLMRISELMAQAGGDPSLQFLELEMTDVGQHIVGGHELHFFDAQGNLLEVFTIPSNVTNDASGDTILFGTDAFAAVSTAAPDFIIPAGLLDPFGGRICFASIDCVAYGSFTGDNFGYGAPAEGFPVLGVLSLARTRTDFPLDNSTDYALQAPSPRNNARQDGQVSAMDPECYLEDDFDDLSSWDVPEPGAGVDLTDCGAPARVDIGTLEVQDGKLLVVPGLEDQLGLGNPIAFASMSNAAALGVIGQTEDQTYRVRFDMLAQFGIVQAAFFVRQHNGFDVEEGYFEPISASGMGFNITFGCHQPQAPDPCPDNSSDHSHPDVRSACIAQNNGALTRGDSGPEFTDLETMEPETPYTVVMDVDGDDAVGPLTLQVKFFRAGEPEPAGYTTGWQADFGITASEEDIHDRLFLLAALRSGGAAPGPVLEVSNFAVCPIPENQRRVRFLDCRRDVGSASVTWDNPFDADTDEEIVIRVDGEIAGTVPGHSTSFLIDSPPNDDFTVSVVNFSGAAATCSVCLNDEPVPVIDAPETATLTDGTAVIAFDSSGSTDPEGTGLTRFWEIVDAPQGALPFFDDPTAVRANLTVDREGDYTVRLVVTDSGCPGDDFGLTSEAEHTVEVESPDTAPGFLRGDCNSDGDANIADAIFHLSFLFLPTGRPPTCREACNVNGDGQSDLSDAIALLTFLFTGGATPPPPGPDACAKDPEPETSLGCDEPEC